MLCKIIWAGWGGGRGLRKVVVWGGKNKNIRKKLGGGACYNDRNSQ